MSHGLLGDQFHQPSKSATETKHKPNSTNRWSPKIPPSAKPLVSAHSSLSSRLLARLLPIRKAKVDVYLPKPFLMNPPLTIHSK